jgi:hypothetical protein
MKNRMRIALIFCALNARTFVWSSHATAAPVVKPGAASAVLNGTYVENGYNPRHHIEGSVSQRYVVSGSSIRGVYSFKYNGKPTTLVIEGELHRSSVDLYPDLGERGRFVIGPNSPNRSFHANVFWINGKKRVKLVSKDNLDGLIGYIAINEDGSARLAGRAFGLHDNTGLNIFKRFGKFDIDAGGANFYGKRVSKSAPKPPKKPVLSPQLQYVLDKILHMSDEAYFEEPDTKKVADKIVALIDEGPVAVTSSSPVLTKAAERRDSILKNTPAQFVIADNPQADEKAPPVEWPWASTVDLHQTGIKTACDALGVDPDLVRSIMYIETTHGWYDGPLNAAGINASILPMNVNVSYWSGLGISRKYLQLADVNIFVGAYILRGLVARVPSREIPKIATLYNSMAYDDVKDYGSRVNQIYGKKPWVR